MAKSCPPLSPFYLEKIRTMGELYQLRADVIRGRQLSSDEVLRLIEELMYVGGCK